jgi:hypothetical protein
MMHTRNCKKVHDYLTKDLFDMDLLERLLRINIGDELVNDTWKKLEDHFQQKASNLRDYFEMLDSRVAELKQIGGGEEMILMQR